MCQAESLFIATVNTLVYCINKPTWNLGSLKFDKRGYAMSSSAERWRMRFMSVLRGRDWTVQ